MGIESLKENLEKQEDSDYSSSPLPEKIQDEVMKKVTDPALFLSSFRESEEYKNTYRDFYKDKKISPDVSPSELVETFESLDVARRCLISYSQKNAVILKYTPSMYSEDFNENYREYLGVIKDIKNKYIADKDSILHLDSMRSSYHNTSAKALIDQNITQSTKISRGLIELMTIEKGLDTFSNVQVSESDRLRWKLTAGNP